MFMKKPARHPPKLPLPTNVQPRTEDDQQVFFHGHGQKGRQVQERRKLTRSIAKVKDTFLGFVEVPRDISKQKIILETINTSLGA